MNDKKTVEQKTGPVQKLKGNFASLKLLGIIYDFMDRFDYVHDAKSRNMLSVLAEISKLFLHNDLKNHLMTPKSPPISLPLMVKNSKMESQQLRQALFNEMPVYGINVQGSEKQKENYVKLLLNALSDRKSLELQTLADVFNCLGADVAMPTVKAIHFLESMIIQQMIAPDEMYTIGKLFLTAVEPYVHPLNIVTTIVQEFVLKPDGCLSTQRSIKFGSYVETDVEWLEIVAVAPNKCTIAPRGKQQQATTGEQRSPTPETTGNKTIAADKAPPETNATDLLNKRENR